MRNLKLVILFCLTVILTGCSSVRGVKNFVACDFSFDSVSDTHLSGTDITGLKSYKDLKPTLLASLFKSFAKNGLNLSFNVNVNVKNPNNAEAKFTGMDYIVYIDNVKMLTGKMDKRLDIAAGQSTVMPCNFQLNISDLFKGEKREKAVSFAFGLATKQEESSRVKLAFKPYLSVGKKTIKFPAYITIGGDKLMSN